MKVLQAQIGLGYAQTKPILRVDFKATVLKLQINFVFFDVIHPKNRITVYELTKRSYSTPHLGENKI